MFGNPKKSFILRQILYIEYLPVTLANLNSIIPENVKVKTEFL